MFYDNDKISEIFYTIEDGKTEYPCYCPVCNYQDAHIFIYKHNEKHGGIWTWCSNCGAFSHMSGVAPKWWKNPDFVDSAHLCGDPEYLDQMKEKIDEWTNSIIPKGIINSRKPFIMENRFDVILEKDLQGVPAGTSGTIVVKDDFKNMIIEFISVDGERISIHETPDDLLRIVRVIKQSDNNQ